MIAVEFINAIARSETVRRRTFTDEAAYLIWLAAVRDLVEIVSVSRVEGCAA